MASRTFDMDNVDHGEKGDPKMTEDAEDDTTETAGSNRTPNDAEEREFNVKWQLPGHHDVTSAKKEMQDIIAYLLITHPNAVTMMDGKKREWCFGEGEDADKFATECQKISVSVHPVKNRQKQVIRWVSITRIRSIPTIQEWKDNDHFYSAVAEAKIYIFPHPFPTDAWPCIIPKNSFINNYTK